ncbi:helix-turn-helix domain-containing protein [Klebsiella pneumoniae]|uniref:helix-turn-helix domain-containing protein n=1 Tax=Klebsiella pneumoniae TaxID=573 RepID=UPI00203D49D6|nr:helix-turn-helix domain-containing protein [Klebsiella pneumoniae]USC03941.1 helix-turn-helix domain-containing protein [Klebsiella pneumoniae]
MELYIITDNNFLYAGFANMLHGTIYTVHRISANEVNNTLIPVGTFIIVDGINHAITCNGYRSLDYQNIPVFFYLNVNRCLFSHLSGINILDASATTECLQNRLVNIFTMDQLNYANRVFFTRKETYILHLYLSGMTSLQISQNITVNHRTVGCHLRHILEKTGIKNSAHIPLLKNILIYHLAHYD